VKGILWISVAAAACVGCGGETRSHAYEASYKAAYQDAESQAYRSGMANGRAAGVEAAKRAARTGSAWMFYRTEAWFALILGLVIGIGTQYIVMVLSAPERCVTFWAAVLVPAMRHSLAYGHFKRKRDFVLATNEEHEKLRLAESVQTAEIRASHEIARKKLLSVSILDELRVKQITNAANDEMAKIVSSAPKVAHSCKCPFCARSIGYGEKKAGKVVWCPHCGQRLTLPSRDSAE